MASLKTARDPGSQKGKRKFGAIVVHVRQRGAVREVAWQFSTHVIRGKRANSHQPAAKATLYVTGVPGRAAPRVRRAPRKQLHSMPLGCTANTVQIVPDSVGL